MTYDIYRHTEAVICMLHKCGPFYECKYPAVTVTEFSGQLGTKHRMISAFILGVKRLEGHKYHGSRPKCHGKSESGKSHISPRIHYTVNVMVCFYGNEIPTRITLSSKKERVLRQKFHLQFCLVLNTAFRHSPLLQNSNLCPLPLTLLHPLPVLVLTCDLLLSWQGGTENRKWEHGFLRKFELLEHLPFYYQPGNIFTLVSPCYHHC